jgi:hypothetical protein
MFYPQEFCPHCQELRDMDVTLSLHPVSGTDIEGATLKIETRCVVCHTLLYQAPLSGEPQEKEMWPSSLYV